MRLRNSMNVHSVAIVSRTKMRLSDTRTRSMFADIRGRVQHWPVMIVRFMIRQAVPVKLILAAIVVKSFLAQVEDLAMGPCPEGLSQNTLRIKTGKIVSVTYKMFTNLASATPPRNSTGRTIFGST
uniref:Uncharacterized protein n=1 Tax=Photinus pyralis TaxID=7054 RepID=A0A1Y1KPS2_PHOPY